MKRERNKSVPDFLCIGLPKTGTSWLYTVLLRHKEVNLPLFKELNFYYQDEFHFKRSVWAMFFHKDWYNKQRRSKLNQLLKDLFISKKIIKPTVVKNNFLHILYLFFPRSRYFYRHLFKNDGKMCGDISPLYSSLNKENITMIHQSNPGLKILLIFRNPVERLWSHIKMDLSKDQLFKDGTLSLENIKIYIDQQLSDYSYYQIYKNWIDVFPASQIGLFFYEDLKKDTEIFYKRLCIFLGIDPEQLKGNKRAIIDRIILKGEDIEITPHIFNYILMNYKDDLDKLYQILPDPRINAWLEVNIRT